MRMEASFVKQQIERLFVSFPEMADDEILRRDAVESETDATRPAGQWNQLRILITPARCEHTMNGVKYCDYVKGQLRELLTQYGPIGGIWFDGHWEHDAKQEHATEIVKLIRSLQPGIMINDRISLPEDYDTPEQNIPGGALPNGRLWETCMTINGHWGYAWSDSDFKSSTALVRNLCDVVSKGGNFLLNVGPDAHGVIPSEEVTRLADVGHWLKSNGQSVYGASQNPFKVLPYPGRCTIKGDTLYLQPFEWPAGGLALSSLKTPVMDAHVLGTGESLRMAWVNKSPCTVY